MLRLSPYDELELLSKVAQGDEFAFWTLFNAYKKKVLFVATGLLNSNDAAEDVLQETFTKIWINKENLIQINNFSSYLRLIVRNEAFDLLRRKARMDAYIEKNKKGAEGELYDLPEDPFEERQKKLTEAMKGLTPRQRKVFELCGLEGRKQSEAAEILGISKETVKKHMADAYKSIRNFLKATAKLFFILLLILIF